MPESRSPKSWNSLPSDHSPAVHQTLARAAPVWTGWRIGGGLLAIALLMYTGHLSDLSFLELLQGVGRMAGLVSSFFPPDFTDWGSYLQATVETIAMGVWGTVLAVIVAVPLAILAADNVCPGWIVLPVRRGLDAMRAIHEMVFALIFISAVGLGPFAGVLALFVHTTGTLGKLFSEAIEAIDPGPVEGIRATGATPIQEVIFGIMPQVLPLWVSYVLYRFEANVRSAAVLGLVGAGGIGVALYQNFRAFNYPNVCAILIILVVTVALIDTLSARIRRWLV